MNPHRKIDHEAKNSEDGDKPSDLPAEPGAGAGADSGKLRLIPKLDASKLPPPPMKP